MKLGRSLLPPNGASEAKSPEVNVVELANRSQHAKIFQVQVKNISKP
jgi:hypothetical protein